MSVVASETSPLNCRWITWNDRLPVCARPLEPPHRVSEFECSICEFWDQEEGHPPRPLIHRAAAHPGLSVLRHHDPLDTEACPRCGSHDVVLKQRDALVQSFVCSICHQHWLATRPWPLMRDPGTHRAES